MCVCVSERGKECLGQIFSVLVDLQPDRADRKRRVCVLCPRTMFCFAPPRKMWP